MFDLINDSWLQEWYIYITGIVSKKYIAMYIRTVMKSYIKGIVKCIYRHNIIIIHIWSYETWLYHMTLVSIDKSWAQRVRCLSMADLRLLNFSWQLKHVCMIQLAKWISYLVTYVATCQKLTWLDYVHGLSSHRLLSKQLTL